MYNSEKAIELNDKGLALYIQGALDEAIGCYDEAIKHNPKDAVIWNNKGLAFYARGKLEEATGCYDEAIELSPMDADYWNNKGNAFYAQGKFEEAIGCYNEAIKLSPQNADCWNNKGLTLYDQGKFEEAIGCYDEAIKLSPQNADYWNNKGNAFYAQRKFEEAVGCYNEAIKLSPQNADCWNNKGLTLYDQGKFEEAIGCHDEAIKLSPQNADYWNNKGLAFNAQGKLEKAIGCYDEVIKLNPQNADYWNNKGNAFYAQGKFEEAVGCYDEAIKLSPMDADCWNNKGLTLYDQGKFEEAIGCYNEAIKHKPMDVIIRNNKGLAFYAQGKLEEAISCYDEAIKLNPKDETARNNKSIALEAQEKQRNQSSGIGARFLNFIAGLGQPAANTALVSSNSQMSHSATSNIPKSFEITLSSIKLDRRDKQKRLGKGAFGTVYLARWQNLNVAVKEMNGDMSDTKEIERFKREAKILSDLRHANIVTLYGVNFEQSLMIVMEYCPRDNLRKLLNQQQGLALSIKQQYEMGLDIAQGLDCIHRNGIMHLDLKPENILISSEGRLKLTDFGISTTQTQVNDTATGARGTVTYMSPEMLESRSKEEAFTAKGDIYSYGLILWELVTCIKPYQEQIAGWPQQQQMIKIYKLIVDEQKRPEPSPDRLAHENKTTYNYAQLISRCWAQRREDRPDAQKIISCLEQTRPTA